MDGLTLERVIRKDPHASRIFEGVFASDTLPHRLKSRPALLIVNSDPISKPGTHWLAISIDAEGRGEFFDSYGLKPYIPGHRRFLNRMCKSWKYNNFDLQALRSTVCGQYCVMYLLFKAHGYTLHDFVTQFFSDDCNNNDRVVANMFKRYSKKITLCKDFSAKRNHQSCCERRK